MLDRRRFVVVVVVHVKAGVRGPPLGDEVDELLERALLVAPVEGPELRVRGLPPASGSRGVDDSEEVLQAELLAVLGVVARPLDVEEEVACCGLRERQQPAVRDEGALLVDLGVQQLVADRTGVLALDLEPGLQLCAPRDEGLRRPSRAARPGREPAASAIPTCLSATRWLVGMPATSERSSSSRRWRSQSVLHRQIAQCSIGSG